MTKDQNPKPWVRPLPMSRDITKRAGGVLVQDIGKG